ncbi:phosphate regulon sensor histidine kinase PhoR [Xylophilus sp.]|uniref:phosphate regulon sensor histidine kinase PhoR n=1 Tax=Xylophilus sp. TaxID=2653893 RepID=UPI0013B6D504|nr:phosphate regulon sensor histidine kinase PhoR [Xylophilus sp.]KAF1047162.1 MAG: Phosphate regulon sensor protein PhoR [Xylophilus sp.]
MALRFFFFLLFPVVGAGIGERAANMPGACGGAIAGSMLWFAWDAWRAARVLRWLRGDAAGTPPPLRGLWGDVIDRARKQLRLRDAQLREAQDRLQEFLAALQASPSGVILLDPQGCIEWSNQTAMQLLGIDSQRDMQQPIGNLLRDPAFNSYQAGRDFSHDIVILGPNSTAGRPVKLSVQLHPYGQGRKLLLARDVTAVEQAEAMRRDFVANVSHEIRTPLTVLAGFIETLQTLQLDAGERSRYLDLMGQQGKRMQTVVNDLLTLSRLEGSPLPSLLDWAPVQPLLQRCEDEARALSVLLTHNHARAHEIHFPDLSDTAAFGEVAGSAGELQSAFSNLVSNAVRYTPAGGTITVRWRWLADGRAEFSVQDTGPGIAPEHIPRLTERFYRVDRSRSRDTGGTGLGLAIVKHVVQRHGAALRIDSTPGTGSTFSITLPAKRLRQPVQPAAVTAA